LDQNSKGWILENVRYLRSIRDSIRLRNAIQNLSTPRWIPTYPLELELIKSLEWLLRNRPFHFHQVSPPRSLPGAPPKPVLANPFAALLPGAQEPGPPSEQTRHMHKELEKTLLQHLAEEAAARKKKEKDVKK
jgi:hypothetical protein